MKKLKFGMLMIALLGLTVVACNKDQRAVKDRTGSWSMTSAKVDGTEWIQPGGITATYSFNDCKVKNDDCTGSTTINYPGFGSETTAFTYSVSSKGTKITIMTADTSSADIVNASINTLTDTELSFSGVDSDGDSFEYTFTKN